MLLIQILKFTLGPQSDFPIPSRANGLNYMTIAIEPTGLGQLKVVLDRNWALKWRNCNCSKSTTFLQQDCRSFNSWVMKALATSSFPVELFHTPVSHPTFSIPLLSFQWGQYNSFGKESQIGLIYLYFCLSNG